MVDSKQTDIGSIPNAWTIYTLGEVSDIYRGGSPRPIEAFLTTNPDGINWIKIGDVSNNAKYIYTTKERIIPEGLSKSRYVKAGDFLLSNSMSFGRPYILRTTGCIHDGWLVIKNYEKTFIKDFLYYMLGYERVLIQYKAMAAGSSVLNLNKEIVSKVVLGFPNDKIEQTAIAEVLSDTDALITILEKRIAKKRNIKQGSMQKLLSPKDDWKIKKLGEVASIFKGKGLPKSALVVGGRYKCIHYGELFIKYKENIIEYLSYTNKKDDCFYSIRNDVLMPTSDVTPNGLATASCVLEDNVIIGGDILVIRIPENVINGIFLSYSIKKSREQVMKLVTGSTVYHIYGSDMANFVFKYPKIEEQNRVVTILSDMDREINALEKKLSKTKELKQGLMQQLLTGNIRLV